MQTWAKRGIQTALVTGGLLMLGTGIASADEDVNPDRPASPLDGSLNIPINIDNNVIGTPLGPIDAPSITEGVDLELSGLGDAAGTANDLLGPVTGSCTTACAPAEEGAMSTDPAEAVDPAAGAEGLRGNRVNGDLVIPVDVSGNAIGALGDAAVENTSAQTVDASRPVDTEGHDLLAGNVVDLDYALPVQVTGNAISGLGNARSDSTSTQEAKATGDIATDGSGGTIAGNVLAPQGATPLQVTGNAVSALGTAESESTASTVGTAGGTIWSDGAGSLAGGNVGAVPVAFPLEVNGNSVGGAAATSADTTHTAQATAGREVPGRWDRPTYIQTNGDPSALAGNVVEPALAGPASVECNAGSALAVSDATCTSKSPTVAGGTVQTNGSDSLGAGNVAAPAVALPTEGFANAVTAGGDAIANEENTVSSDAGGAVFTLGEKGVAGGNIIGPSASGPIDVLTNAGAGAGTATANSENTSTTTAGGFSGTNGSNALGGGNTALVPVALPTEGFGNVAGGLGTASSSTTETKVSSSGGDGSTDDAGGFLAANQVQGALSGPAQVIGNGAGALGNTTSSIDADNTVTAGGDNTATGTEGTLAGNIGQAAVSLPAQLFGDNVTAGGVGNADAVVDTVSTAGGHAQTDGTNGLGTGNVATVPAASAAQLFGDSAAALGLSSAQADSTTESVAGGDTKTSGLAGTIAGNVASPQALPIVQGFGAAIAGLGGVNDATGTNDTDATSGGDIATTGDSGTISGNLADVPLAGVVQPFGDAVSAIGADATGIADSDTTGAVGGTSTTSGIGGFLSGLDGTVPLGVNLPIYDLPVEVLAQAIAEATNISSYQVGEAEPTVNMPLGGDTVGGLGITDMPRLPEMPVSPEMAAFPELSTLDPAALTELPEQSGPAAEARAVPPMPGLGAVSGLLGGLLGGLGNAAPTGDLAGGAPGGLPGGDMLGGLTGMLGAVPGVPGVPGIPAVPGLNNLPQLPGVPTTMPAPAPRIAAPALPTSGLGDLPELGDLGDLTGLADLTQLSELVESLVDGQAPALSEVPGLPELPGAPDAGQLPNIPGVPGMPGMPGVPAIPGLPNLPNLNNVPLAQAPSLDRLPVHTPALSGLDTSTVLNPTDAAENASLADTQSKLATLFGHHPIGS